MRVKLFYNEQIKKLQFSVLKTMGTNKNHQYLDLAPELANTCKELMNAAIDPKDSEELIKLDIQRTELAIKRKETLARMKIKYNDVPLAILTEHKEQYPELYI